MPLMDSEHLVGDYLNRLAAAGQRLPSARREELLTEVSEHIEVALRAEPARTEVAVRNVLDRLGSPEDIVAAEVETGPGPGPAAPPAVADGPESPWGVVEIFGVALLVAGGLLPVIGPLIGLALVWLSSRWTRQQKAIGTSVALLPLLLAVPFILAGPD